MGEREREKDRGGRKRKTGIGEKKREAGVEERDIGSHRERTIE